MIDLSSIAKTTKLAKPPRIVLYGPQGSGKTTFGASADAPVFLPFEDGLSGLEVNSFPLLTTWDDTQSALKTLRGKHDFKTAVIDTADWLQTVIFNTVAAAYNKKTIEEIPYGKGYNEAAPYWLEFFHALDALRDKGIIPLILAHSEIKRYESPDTDPYDRYQIKLHKIGSALLTEWADIVAFTQPETSLRSSGNAKARAIGTGKRFIHVSDKPSHVAKTRYIMPDRIPLDWSEFIKSIG